MSKYLDSNGLLYLWNSKIKPALAKYVPLAGGTMTGKLKLSGAPTEDMDAATKKYVDDSVASAGGGDMMKACTTPTATASWTTPRRWAATPWARTCRRTRCLLTPPMRTPRPVPRA